eukprot:359347-Chlamydomonas_euryale.AAC.6
MVASGLPVCSLSQLIRSKTLVWPRDMRRHWRHTRPTGGGGSSSSSGSGVAPLWDAMLQPSASGLLDALTL